MMMLLLALALADAPRPGPTHPDQPPALAEYLRDLTGSDAADRLFAARELRRRVRANDRAYAHSRDELTRLESTQERSDHLHLTAPACETVLRDPTLANAVGPCADILRLLNATDARPALLAARAADPGPCARRKLDRALAALPAP